MNQVLNECKRPVANACESQNSGQKGRAVLTLAYEAPSMGAEGRGDALPDSTAALITCAQQGDRQAFERLMRRYDERLKRALSGRLQRTDMLADVMQETFLRAFRFIAQFRGDSQFYSWLYRIAMNVGAMVLAKQSRRAEVALDECVASQGWSDTLFQVAGPEQCLQREQHVHRVYKSLAHLPFEQRTALGLRIDGHGYDYIARVLGCPVGTVRSRIARARDKLASLMHDDAAGWVSSRCQNGAHIDG